MCIHLNEPDKKPISSREDSAREIEDGQDHKLDLKKTKDKNVGHVEVVKNDGTSEILANETTDTIEYLYNENVDNVIDGSIDEELFKKMKMKNSLLNKRVVSDRTCENDEINMQIDSSKETTEAEITEDIDRVSKPGQKIDAATMMFECEKVFSSKSDLKRHISMNTGIHEAAGQQIRSKIDSFQNAYFLISQQNPMMLPLIGIVSERRFQ